jgi:hypothetical protein
VGQFTTSKADSDLDLVALREELLDELRLDLDVVLAHVGPEANLLEGKGFLALLGLTFALGLLELKAPEVEQLAHRGIGLGRDLDEVDVPSPGQVERGGERKDA